MGLTEHSNTGSKQTICKLSITNNMATIDVSAKNLAGALLRMNNLNNPPMPRWSILYHNDHGQPNETAIQAPTLEDAVDCAKRRGMIVISAGGPIK